MDRRFWSGHYAPASRPRPGTGDWAAGGGMADFGALGGLYAARGAYGEAGTIIHRLAETIDEEELRVGFLTAVSVQSVLALSEMV